MKIAAGRSGWPRHAASRMSTVLRAALTAGLDMLDGPTADDAADGCGSSVQRGRF